MSHSGNHETLKAFIKDTLGCGCPDSVFENINVETYRLDGYSRELGRIVVGDTLLIYIVRPDQNHDLEDSINVIALAGKTDRDTHHYNRFRLVVAADGNNPQPDTISNRFARSFGADEKMHIHFVADQCLDGLGV